jgi:hypothetical protein
MIWPTQVITRLSTTHPSSLALLIVEHRASHLGGKVLIKRMHFVRQNPALNYEAYQEKKK